MFTISNFTNNNDVKIINEKGPFKSLNINVI